MSEIDDLRAEVKKLAASRQWWIAAASALIAAIASITAAYFGYSAQKETIEANRDVSRTEGTFDVYKEFGKSIIMGEQEERCRALLLITAIDTQPGSKLITAGVSKQLDCDKPKQYVEALNEAIGKACLDMRPTRTTLRSLNEAQMATAESICQGIAEIPGRFEGPWPDGTVSFPTREVIAGMPVWCNCLPKSFSSPGQK